MTHVTIVASPEAGPAQLAKPPAAVGDFIWTDEAACAAMAAELAQAMKPGLLAGNSAYIELHGTLGAGKTTFTRHLLRALGVQGRIKSPSYAVVEPHDAPGMAIHHFDFYRFNDPQEWEDAGFRDLFAAPGLKLAEWPEKAAGLLPRADLQIHIQPPPQTDEGDQRTVRVEAFSPTGHQALKALHQALQAAGAASTCPAGEPAAGAQAHG